MNGDEYYFPGGVYPDDNSDRSDVYLQESGPGVNEGCGIPLSLILRIVSGNCEMVLIDVPPAKMVELGKWISKTALDVIEREKRDKMTEVIQ